MHIHLPKPLHGWRAFFGEVGVIVLGVIIALGLEQTAAAVHDSVVAGEAREAIRAEVRENLWWMDRRAKRESCIRARLAELGDLIARARAGESVPVVHYLGMPLHGKITMLRWEANAQAGRASLFPGDEQRTLGNMYFTTEQFADAQKQEETVWSKMRFIQGVARLTPEDVHDLSIFLAEARYQNFILLLTVKRAHQWATVLKLTPSDPSEFAIVTGKIQICEKLAAALVPPGPDPTGLPEDEP
jgi:hypothetical protein